LNIILSFCENSHFSKIPIFKENK